MEMIFMLWRKRQKDIIAWIYNEKKELLVTGARTIGKTYLIKKTLEQENCDFVEFNLIKQPETVKLFVRVINIVMLPVAVIVFGLMLWSSDKKRRQNIFEKFNKKAE